MYKYDFTKAEGIFRLQADQQDCKKLWYHLDQLPLGLSKLPMDLVQLNPHVIAVCLKRFLSQLSISLIPLQYYQRCLTIAKKMKMEEQQGSQVLKEDKGEEEVKEEKNQSINHQIHKLLTHMKQYQAVNVNILKYLALMCQDIVANTDINRMTYKSLGVVLAPCIFHNTISLVPVDQRVENFRLESLFITQLFQQINVQTIKKNRNKQDFQVLLPFKVHKFHQSNH